MVDGHVIFYVWWHVHLKLISGKKPNFMDYCRQWRCVDADHTARHSYNQGEFLFGTASVGRGAISENSAFVRRNFRTPQGELRLPARQNCDWKDTGHNELCKYVVVHLQVCHQGIGVWHWANITEWSEPAHHICLSHCLARYAPTRPGLRIVTHSIVLIIENNPLLRIAISTINAIYLWFCVNHWSPLDRGWWPQQTNMRHFFFRKKTCFKFSQCSNLPVIRKAIISVNRYFLNHIIWIRYDFCMFNKYSFFTSWLLHVQQTLTNTLYIIYIFLIIYD